MDEDGVQQAFCELYWRANGGQFDSRGVPIIRGDGIRGHCPEAYDCNTCTLMQQELSYHPPDEVTWVCPQCAAELINRRQNRGSHLLLRGYYCEGECQSPFCVREDRHSPLLQLVLGKIRKESG